MIRKLLACVVTLAAITAVPAEAQDKARLNWVKLNSAAIEGNLEGNSAERKVLVVTPPGYDENTDKRYPVVYYLHGYWMPVDKPSAPCRMHWTKLRQKALFNGVFSYLTGAIFCRKFLWLY